VGKQKRTSDKKKSKTHRIKDNASLQRRQTERKKAEAALGESQMSFRGAFDNAAIGMALVAPDGRWLQVNRALCEIVGYTEQELLATTFQAITHVDDLEPDLNYVRQMLAGEIQTYQMEKRYLHKLGHIVWILLSVALVRDPQAKPLFFISQIQDITERKQAETALAERERLLRTIIEAEPECVKRLAPDGTLLDMNAAGLAMIEADSLDEVRGQSVCPLVTPEYRNTFENLIRRVSQGESGMLEFEIVGLKGTRRWLETHSVPLRSEGNEVLSVLSITRDITERKQAEQAHRESEARLQAILDNSPTMIFLKDTEGRYLLKNREFVKLAHRPGEEIIGKTDAELFSPEQAAAFRANDCKVLESGVAMEFEEVALHDDGPHISLVHKFPLRDEKGTMYAVGGIVMDITGRKRAEVQVRDTLAQLHALASHLQSIREKERARIAREVHDELGQALTGLQLGLSWVAGKLTPEQRQVQQRVTALSALVDTTTQAVRRISTALRPSVLDDLGLIAALEWLASEFTSNTGIRCEFVSGVDAVELNPSTSTAIFRIAQETLTNVIRHAEATTVAITLRKMGLVLVLLVQDNGKGIDDNKISDPRSLGLLGMRERARMCGGDVSFSGHPGRGTTVTLQIPLEPLA
jgi:PAS domain S-box-containing protein